MLVANCGYVIVEVEKNPNVSPGGIVLPENSVKESNKGVVYDHGVVIDDDLVDAGIEFFSLTVYTVFFPLYAGHKLVYEGKEYLVLKEEEILAFVKKD